MPKVKREHFIPEFYLKMFCSENDQLWVYDKFTKRVFKTNVANIASESYFYDLPDSAMTENIDKQTVEAILSRMEDNFKNTLDEMLDLISTKRRITRNQKRTLAFHLAIQYLRTSEHRRQYVESSEKMAHVLLTEMATASRLDISMDDYVVEFDRQYASLYHTKHMSNPRLLDPFIKALENHIWILGENKTSQPFYASDVPIVKKAHGRSSGVESEGIEIAFPLTPKYILIMKERRFFKTLKNLDCRCKVLDKGEVSYYNELQVFRSYQQIYCPLNSFSQAKTICLKHPEICTPDRTRVSFTRYPQPNGALIHWKTQE
jgi:hypothetical protein